MPSKERTRRVGRSWSRAVAASVVGAAVVLAAVHFLIHRDVAEALREVPIASRVRAATETAAVTQPGQAMHGSTSVARAPGSPRGPWTVSTAHARRSAHLSSRAVQPVAHGPLKGKRLALVAAGYRRALQHYDPQARTDIPIVMDVLHGRAENLAQRLDSGLNPSMTVLEGPGPEDRESLLAIAVGAGQRAVIRDLIDRGASITYHAPFEDTPLQEAAGLGETDVVQLLLDRGANINSDAGGQTALDIAVAQNDYAMTKMLLRYGGDPGQISSRLRYNIDHSANPAAIAVRKLLDGN